MTRSNLLAVVTFAVVFAAGVMVGKLGWGGAATAGGADGAWLANHLNLDPRQRDAVRKIWMEQLTDVSAGTAKRWSDVERQRDEKVRAILDTNGQRSEYDKIVTWYETQVVEFRRRLDESQKSAEEHTRQLLNASQQQRFDQLVSERKRRQMPTALPTANPVSDVRPASEQP